MSASQPLALTLLPQYCSPWDSYEWHGPKASQDTCPSSKSQLPLHLDFSLSPASGVLTSREEKRCHHPVPMPQQQLNDACTLSSMMESEIVADYGLEDSMAVDVDLDGLLYDLDSWSADLLPSSCPRPAEPSSTCRTNTEPLHSLGSYVSSDSNFQPRDRDGTPGACSTDAEDLRLISSQSYDDRASNADPTPFPSVPERRPRSGRRRNQSGDKPKSACKR